MSEDERIRQQCQARDDYERRLIGQYNQGMAEGISQGISQGIPLGRRELIQNALRNGMSLEDVSQILCVTPEEVEKAQEEV